MEEYQKYYQIGTGIANSIAIVAGGKDVHAWGSNTQGQLGVSLLSYTTIQSTPVSVRNLNANFTQVAQSTVPLELVRNNPNAKDIGTSFAVTSDGRMFSFGSAEFGLLGYDTSSTQSSVPTQVAIPERYQVLSMTTSGLFILAVTDCRSGYYGSDCSLMNCSGVPNNSSSVCSGNGVCIAPNVCKCDAGYYGSNCESYDCFGTQSKAPNACSGNGQCVAPNSCKCNANYTGSRCESWSCYGLAQNATNVCGGQGSCIAFNNCSCRIGYEGNMCDRWQCYGVADTIACSYPNGTCVGPNQCFCEQRYNGTTCNYWSCSSLQMNDPLACHGENNYCIAPETCLCIKGYGGKNCAPVCYGIVASSLSVCNGHGVCTAPDRCQCTSGYGGPECDFPLWAIVPILIGSIVTFCAILLPVLTAFFCTWRNKRRQHRIETEVNNRLLQDYEGGLNTEMESVDGGAQYMIKYEELEFKERM
jgi:hypothetical protein